MSGVKRRRITIDEARYNRLLREAAHATSLARANEALTRLEEQNRQERERMNGVINGLTRSTTNLRHALDRAHAETSSLRNALAEQIVHSDEAIRAEAQRRQREVAQLQENMQSELTHVRNEAEANSRRLQAHMDRSVAALQEEIRTREANLQDQIDSVRTGMQNTNARLDRMEQGNEALLEHANIYAEVAGTVVANTRAGFPHGAAMVSDADAVKAGNQAASQIREAHQNPMNASVARLAAMEAYDAAMEYRMRVEAAELQWQEHYQQAMEALHLAQAQLEASRMVEVAGQKFPTDHWSNGLLGNVETDLSRIQAMLEAAKQPSAADSVEEIDAMAEAARSRCEAIDQAAVFATTALEGSQHRVTSAQGMAQRMYDNYGLNFVADANGYAAVYAGNDQRGAYRFHMRNEATGLDIVITILPEYADGTLCEVVETDIISEGTIGHDAAETVVQSILGDLGLSTEGYQAGTICTESGYENRTSDRPDIADLYHYVQTKPKLPRAPYKPAQLPGTKTA